MEDQHVAEHRERVWNCPVCLFQATDETTLYDHQREVGHILNSPTVSLSCEEQDHTDCQTAGSCSCEYHRRPTDGSTEFDYAAHGHAANLYANFDRRNFMQSAFIDGVEWEKSRSSAALQEARDEAQRLTAAHNEWATRARTAESEAAGLREQVEGLRAAVFGVPMLLRCGMIHVDGHPCPRCKTADRIEAATRPVPAATEGQP